jgi:hypothetical protein
MQCEIGKIIVKKNTKRMLDDFKEKFLYPKVLGYTQEIHDVWDYDELLVMLMLGFDENKAQPFIELNETFSQFMRLYKDKHNITRGVLKDATIRNERVHPLYREKISDDDGD